mgnify:CR=1 FL=1
MQSYFLSLTMFAALAPAMSAQDPVGAEIQVPDGVIEDAGEYLVLRFDETEEGLNLREFIKIAQINTGLNFTIDDSANAITDLAGKRLLLYGSKRIKKEDIAATLRADGIATTIGGTFNSFPYTAFSENVGLVRLTGVRSRWVVATAGLFMILLGLLPKTAAVVASIPPPVLGGAALALFATVAVVGIQTLSKVDFTDHRNLIIVATSLGLAMLVTIQPTVSQGVPAWLEMLFGSGIVLGAVSAIVLNVLFFHVGGRGRTVAGGPGKGITLEQVNAMSPEEFASTFGGLVQGTPWVVERAYEQRPFADAHGLREAFQAALLAGTTEEQLELINNYPDLGSEDATGTLNAADPPGLSNLEEDEHENIVELASEYREHFGFPLVICARETERYDRVLANGWSRIENATATERSFAMIEIAKIANYRFDDLVADANPIASARFGRLAEHR